MEKIGKTYIKQLKEKREPKKVNQPKMKAISEKKKESNKRRKLATTERWLAQKEYHILSKQIEKIEVKPEEECKEMQEELLNEYEDVFAEKLTSEHRINCRPVKLELVKNSDQLPKEQQSHCQTLPI